MLSRPDEVHRTLRVRACRGLRSELPQSGCRGGRHGVIHRPGVHERGRPWRRSWHPRRPPRQGDAFGVRSHRRQALMEAAPRPLRRHRGNLEQNFSHIELKLREFGLRRGLCFGYDIMATLALSNPCPEQRPPGAKPESTASRLRDRASCSGSPALHLPVSPTTNGK